MESESPRKRSRTLTEHLIAGLWRAHQRRPQSFYMLAATPVVLLLALGGLASQDKPRLFALTLGLLFLFLGVVLIRALLDMLRISREHLSEEPRSWDETIGERRFIEELGSRVREHEEP